jgi:hypothetical protein
VEICGQLYKKCQGIFKSVDSNPGPGGSCLLS